MGSRGGSGSRSLSMPTGGVKIISRGDVKPEKGLEVSTGLRLTPLAEKSCLVNYRKAEKFVATHKVKEVTGHEHPMEFGKRNSVSLQTLKGVQSRINKERQKITRSLKAEKITKKEATRRRRILNMMQRGLNRAYNKHKK